MCCYSKIKLQKEKEIAQANSLAELRYKLEQQKAENDHLTNLNTVYESQLKLYESMLEEKEETSNMTKKIEATQIEKTAVAVKVATASATNITAHVEMTNTPLKIAPVEVTTVPGKTVNAPLKMQTSPVLVEIEPAEIHTAAVKEANVSATVETVPLKVTTTLVKKITVPQETVPVEIVSVAQETITAPVEITSAAQETITAPVELISAPQETITALVKTMVARKSSVPENAPNKVRSPVPTPRRLRCTDSISSNAVAEPNDNDAEPSASQLHLL